MTEPRGQGFGGDPAAAGRKGAATVRERLGQEHYVRCGKLGGAATRKRGAEYYAAIGKKGGTSRWAKVRAAKAAAAEVK